METEFEKKDWDTASDSLNIISNTPNINNWELKDIKKLCKGTIPNIFFSVDLPYWSESQKKSIIKI